MHQQLAFTPGLGRDFRDLPVGHGGQAREHVAEISEGIETASAATFNEGVNDGTALTGLGIADEELVFLPMAVGRMAFSTKLLSTSTRPSARYTASVGHWPSV